MKVCMINANIEASQYWYWSILKAEITVLYQK